jgi:hypothetical protein
VESPAGNPIGRVRERVGVLRAVLDIEDAQGVRHGQAIPAICGSTYSVS